MKTILVAEDTPSLRSLLKAFLERRGCRVLLASDGVDAVALALEHSPDLILMDLIMPGKDGVAACRELRGRGVRSPIVMLTSKNVPDDKARALAAGADGYLLKPFDPAALERAIAKHIGS